MIMDILVLIIALLVSLATLFTLLRMLKELNAAIERELDDPEQTIEDLEAMMDQLDKLEE